jgi:hypothetical protein
MHFSGSNGQVSAPVQNKRDSEIQSLTTGILSLSTVKKTAFESSAIYSDRNLVTEQTLTGMNLFVLDFLIDIMDEYNVVTKHSIFGQQFIPSVIIDDVECCQISVSLSSTSLNLWLCRDSNLQSTY